MIIWLNDILDNYHLNSLRKSIKYWDGEVERLEDKLDFARSSLSAYKEELSKYE